MKHANVLYKVTNLFFVIEYMCALCENTFKCIFIFWQIKILSPNISCELPYTPCGCSINCTVEKRNFLMNQLLFARYYLPCEIDLKLNHVKERKPYTWFFTYSRAHSCVCVCMFSINTTVQTFFSSFGQYCIYINICEFI